MTQQQFEELKSLIQQNAQGIQQNTQGISRNYEMIGRIYEEHGGRLDRLSASVTASYSGHELRLRALKN